MQPLITAVVYFLSRLDGRPGLSYTDFAVIYDAVVSIDGTSEDGVQKESEIVSFMKARWPNRVPRWTYRAISFLAYLLARSTGRIVRPEPATWEGPDQPPSEG